MVAWTRSSSYCGFTGSNRCYYYDGGTATSAFYCNDCQYYHSRHRHVESPVVVWYRVSNPAHDFDLVFRDYPKPPKMIHSSKIKFYQVSFKNADVKLLGSRIKRISPWRKRTKLHWRKRV